jgi:hypothetical protein
MFSEGLNESSLRVIPTTIDPDSISCSGQWSKINISWTPATVNYGNVFYEVSIQADRAIIMVQSPRFFT